MSKKKNNSTNKQNQELPKSLKELGELLNIALEDMMQAADIIMYQEGMIYAYRDCLGLDD